MNTLINIHSTVKHQHYPKLFQTLTAKGGRTINHINGEQVILPTLSCNNLQLLAFILSWQA
jgi:hypothetical protein